MYTMKATNNKLRELMFAAGNTAAVEAEDTFLAGHKPSGERADRIAALVAEAEQVFTELYKAGKYSDKALKGCPGAGMRERWANKINGVGCPVCGADLNRFTGKCSRECGQVAPEVVAEELPVAEPADSTPCVVCGTPIKIGSHAYGAVCLQCLSDSQAEATPADVPDGYREVIAEPISKAEATKRKFAAYGYDVPKEWKGGVMPADFVQNFNDDEAYTMLAADGSDAFAAESEPVTEAPSDVDAANHARTHFRAYPEPAPARLVCSACFRSGVLRPSPTPNDDRLFCTSCIPLPGAKPAPSAEPVKIFLYRGATMNFFAVIRSDRSEYLGEYFAGSYASGGTLAELLKLWRDMYPVQYVIAEEKLREAGYSITGKLEVMPTKDYNVSIGLAPDACGKPGCQCTSGKFCTGGMLL